MSKTKHIYQVYHRNQIVGIFAKRKNAVKYSEEFKTNIGGYPYPVKVVKKDLLDYMYEEDDS
jgi:hypothetical protein